MPFLLAELGRYISPFFIKYFHFGTNYSRIVGVALCWPIWGFSISWVPNIVFVGLRDRSESFA